MTEQDIKLIETDLSPEERAEWAKYRKRKKPIQFRLDEMVGQPLTPEDVAEIRLAFGELETFGMNLYDALRDKIARAIEIDALHAFLDAYQNKIRKRE